MSVHHTSGPKRPHEQITRDDYFSPRATKSLFRPFELARDVDGMIYGSSSRYIGNDPYIRSVRKHNEVTRRAGSQIRASSYSMASGMHELVPQ